MMLQAARLSTTMEVIHVSYDHWGPDGVAERSWRRSRCTNPRHRHCPRCGGRLDEDPDACHHCIEDWPSKPSPYEPYRPNDLPDAWPIPGSTFVTHV